MTVSDRADEIDAQPGRKQQVIGPADALSDSNLVVDLARIEMDQAIATAHRFPRRLDVVRRQIEEVVLYDEASAKACVYALPRAGKAIVGPSVNLADALAAAWGNCHDGARFVRVDRGEKLVVCEGIFFDLQSNRRTIATATRRISDSKGRLYTEDMIGVTIAACNSIVRRNVIIRGVPRPIWYPLYERALIVVRGTEATLPERREELIRLFASHGVAPPRIAAALGVTRKDEITLDHMVILQDMWEQLKAGDITAEEMFDPRRMTGMSYDVAENPLGDEEEEATGRGATPPAGTGPGGHAAGHHSPSPTPATSGTPASEGISTAAARPADASSAQGSSNATPTRPNQQAPSAPKGEGAEGGHDVDTTPRSEAAPKTPAEYLAHASAWLAAATSISEIDATWTKERGLRNSVGLTSDERVPLEAEKKMRIAELQGDVPIPA